MWLWIWFMIIKKAILISTINTEYTNFDPWLYCNDIPTWNMYFLTNTPKARIFLYYLQNYKCDHTYYIIYLYILSSMTQLAEKRGRGFNKLWVCKCFCKDKNFFFFLSFLIFEWRDTPTWTRPPLLENLGSKFEK